MFILGGPEVADHVGICSACGGAFHPGAMVVKEEDMTFTHEEHSTWSIPSMVLSLHI